MDIDKVVAASASGNKTSWSVAKITFNVTVKGNPDFKNATGKWPSFLVFFLTWVHNVNTEDSNYCDALVVNILIL